MGPRTSLTLYEGMEGMMENTFLNIKNRSKAITAEVEVPVGGASGAILVQGGRFGGWSLHMREGKPAYEYNFLGLERFVVEGPEALPPGKATIALDFSRWHAGTLAANPRRTQRGNVGSSSNSSYNGKYGIARGLTAGYSLPS